MKERFTEVANISTDVLGELGKLVSAYKAYTETLAAVQRQIEYTEDIKRSRRRRQERILSERPPERATRSGFSLKALKTP